jgi:drug/metabolite transporter (DMT)-like permease
MDKESSSNIYKGMFCMFTATLFFGIADATGKYLSTDLPILQVAWLRGTIGLGLLLLFAVTSGRAHQLKTSRPGWHFFRSLLGVLLLTSIFYSLKYIPLAEVTAIAFSSPFIIALASPLILKESVRKKSWLAIGIGFIGVIIVMRPTANDFHLAHLSAFLFACSLALSTVTARKLITTESPLALNVYMYPAMVVGMSYLAISQWISPDWFKWLLLFVLGFAATSAVGLMVIAVQYVKPSTIAPIDYCRIIWAILLGYIIWGDIPDLYTWVGIVIICLTGLFVLRTRN